MCVCVCVRVTQSTNREHPTLFGETHGNKLDGCSSGRRLGRHISERRCARLPGRKTNIQSAGTCDAPSVSRLTTPACDRRGLTAALAGRGGEGISIHGKLFELMTLLNVYLVIRSSSIQYVRHWFELWQFHLVVCVCVCVCV